ncbi:MAG: WbqC family protein [Rikenellaceae bacterium]|nr:WbqC family protein [Rikenellaceae bacterium]
MTTAFCPPIEYFAVLARYSVVYIEACESYQKQSWRNRCRILSANGPLDLSFPVIHASPPKTAGLPSSGVPSSDDPSANLPSTGVLSSDHPSANLPSSDRLITNIKIEYTTPWVPKMQKAIDSAYDSSPFFEFYRDEFYAILDSKPETLWELNMQIINWLCSKIGITPEIKPTSGFAPEAEEDYRELIHPKRPNDIMKQLGLERPYWQVFGQKFGFVSGLSVLDLLFCKGPESILWLK